MGLGVATARRTVSPRSHAGGLAAAVVLLLAALLVPALPVWGASTTYHVDCAGNDDASGRSPSDAWRSLDRASRASLAPGDRLLLRRGCTWTGPLKLRWSGTSSQPITIGAYGTGDLPKIQNAHDNVDVTGSYLVIESIHTRSDAPARDPGCDNARAGYRIGFRFGRTSAHNVLRDSVANEHYIGVLVDDGSHHNRILNNVLRDNDMKADNPDSDAGAVAISLMGDDNEVAYNDISGSDVCSRFFGRDGSAVEVYGGSRNSIHHNVARQNHIFTEVGIERSSGERSSDNTYAYNLVTASLPNGHFLTTRGPNHRAGPNPGTEAYNNSVYLTGSRSVGVSCGGGCSASYLRLHNNIIWAENRIGSADGAFDEGHNIYWRSDGRPRIGYSISGTSRIANPEWVSAGSGDLHLRSTSPAIDAGSGHALNLGYDNDLDGVAVPQGQAPDVGGYERSGSSPPAPTASASGTPTPSPTPSPTRPPSGTYVHDDFQRTLTDSWGSAPEGGTYTYPSETDSYDTTGSVGTITLELAGSTRAAFLPDVSALDVDTQVRVRTDRPPTGRGQFVYVSARSADTLTEYRFKLRFPAEGGLYLGATRVVDGSRSAIGEPTYFERAAPHVADFWIRAQVIGTDPAVLRAKVWRDGDEEPAEWHYSATDSTPELQSAGRVGLRAYAGVGSTDLPVVSAFDDWTVEAP